MNKRLKICLSVLLVAGSLRYFYLFNIKTTRNLNKAVRNQLSFNQFNYEKSLPNINASNQTNLFYKQMTTDERCSLIPQNLGIIFQLVFYSNSFIIMLNLIYRGKNKFRLGRVNF